MNVYTCEDDLAKGIRLQVNGDPTIGFPPSPSRRANVSPDRASRWGTTQPTTANEPPATGPGWACGAAGWFCVMPEEVDP